jgi:hypothetical protein
LKLGQTRAVERFKLPVVIKRLAHSGFDRVAVRA